MESTLKKIYIDIAERAICKYGKYESSCMTFEEGTQAQTETTINLEKLLLILQYNWVPHYNTAFIYLDSFCE